MTEEEFVALLKLEGKRLIIDRDMVRGKRKNGYKPVATYATYIDDVGGNGEVCGFFGRPYLSRTYAIRKAIKDHYENNR